MAVPLARSRYFRDPPSIVLVKRFALAVVLAHAMLASMSAYRAWVQVRSLDLRVAGPVLGVGTVLDAEVVSWARTHVRVSLELVQDGHAETLAETRVRSNTQAVYDPRWRRAALHAVLTPPQLDRFRPGPALVRATAIGGPQWLRTPPPLVREATVQIGARPGASDD
jgi:hypothetical protein